MLWISKKRCQKLLHRCFWYEGREIVSWEIWKLHFTQWTVHDGEKRTFLKTCAEMIKHGLRLRTEINNCSRPCFGRWFLPFLNRTLWKDSTFAGNSNRRLLRPSSPTLTLRISQIEGSSCGLVANSLNSEIVVREFKNQSLYYVHFCINSLRKGMNPVIHPAMDLTLPLWFFYKTDSALNKLRRLICH